jgi:EpsD family peptidyl-prolyl cis-trans isomerase
MAMIINGLRLCVSGVTVALAMLSLSACGWDTAHSTPKGQVIATVDGIEITQRDLAAEMDMIGGENADPRVAQQAALQQIVIRKILAREARARKLDDSADFGLLKQRSEESVLESLLQRAMIRNLPDPAPADAQRYVSDHPDLFGQRKIFDVEQIRINQVAGPDLVEKIKPLVALDEVQALLDREGIKYQRGSGTLDALQASPDMVKQILALPPGEIFILPMGGDMLVNRIDAMRTVPVGDEAARKFALAYLKQKGVADTLKNQLAEIMKKNKDKIHYQKGYGPKVADTGEKTARSGT